MTPDKIWERKTKETAKAFSAFQIYRDMPPRERSLHKTCEQIGKTWGSYHSHIEKWSAQNDWVERAVAWDTYKDQQTETQRVIAWSQFTLNMEKYVSGLLAKAAARLRNIDDNDIPAAALSRWPSDALKIYRELRGEPSATIKHEVESRGKIEHEILLEIDEFLKDIDETEIDIDIEGDFDE